MLFRSLDFKNPKGIPIRQYFFKYTLPEKYPPHQGKGNYIRTAKPTIAQVATISGQTDSNQTPTASNQPQQGTDQSQQTGTNQPQDAKGALTGAMNFDFKSMFSGLRDYLNPKQQQTQQPQQTTDQQPTDQQPTDQQPQSSDVASTPTVISTGAGGDSNFMDITKRVIANFEGGYWHGNTPENVRTSKMGICPNHPKGSMGKSTETMFGLDRYNGNIESTPEGKEFFGIIDKEKKDLGMDQFCKKWKWLYRGGDKEARLKELASAIMKRSFDRNMNNFVKDPKTKEKILNNRGLLVHMSYASWNGPGFFKKFAKKLEDGVKQGMNDKQLIDLAVQSRASTGLLNKDKVEKGIRNPDSLKT